MGQEKKVQLRDRQVNMIEQGEGTPIVYLHGFADVHGVTADLLPFHEGLAREGRLIAPAHPGCNGSSDYTAGYRIEDILFHYNELFDAVGLRDFILVGHCTGGWIAAEYAVRHPEHVRKLVLIGAAGLFVPGQHIGDIFMHAQPERGTQLASLRRMLFSSENAAEALRYFPDGRGDLDEETRRYGMLRFGSAVGFRPPYFYNRPLVDRLHRATMPALVIWGEKDGMVPLAHGEAYATGLSNAGVMEVIAGAGHAAHIEQGEAVLEKIASFLAREA